VKDPTAASRIMHTAVDEGLTFFDNCLDYHDGGAEEIMGRALSGGRRDKVFLMTKNCERDHAGSMKPRRQSPAAADGSHRRLAVSRNHLRQRSGLGLRARRPEGGARSAEGRQDPLHRLHGSQGSPHPPVDAR
jgi:hypothetical protein